MRESKRDLKPFLPEEVGFHWKIEVKPSPERETWEY